jgi:predicted acetyltransferase
MNKKNKNENNEELYLCRKGHVSTVMSSALALMHDHAVPFSTLYPFKASFYEKTGYVCVCSKRKVTFSPTVFSGLRASPAVRVERKKASDFDKEVYRIWL